MSQDSRITQRFAACKAEGRAAFVGYLTAYDPDFETSRERLFAACEAGLDVLELGVPFSDPSADGPTIQSAMVRALAAGSRLDGVFELATQVRARFETPMVLFSYANPLLRRGAHKTAADAKSAGIDGALVVDMPPEAASELRTPLREAGLDWVGLVAPTSTARRRELVLEASTGFVYAVSLTGVTGAALDAGSEGLLTQLRALKAQAGELPVAVGFGISRPDQVAALANEVDGVIVGSALVKAAQRGTDELATLVRELVAATKRSAS